MILLDVMHFLDANEVERCDLVCAHWLQVRLVFKEFTKRKRVFKELYIEDREMSESLPYKITVKLQHRINF
jgi:hypothetical protein